MGKTVKLSESPIMEATPRLRYVVRNETINYTGGVGGKTPIVSRSFKVLQQLWKPILTPGVVYEKTPKPEWRDVPTEEET